MNAISFGWKVIIKSSRTFYLFVFCFVFTVYGVVLTGRDYARQSECVCVRAHGNLFIYVWISVEWIAFHNLSKLYKTEKSRVVLAIFASMNPSQQTMLNTCEHAVIHRKHTQAHAHANAKPKWLCIWVRDGNFALIHYHFVRKPASPQQQHMQLQCNQWRHTLKCVIMDLFTDAKLKFMNSFVSLDSNIVYNLHPIIQMALMFWRFSALVCATGSFDMVAKSFTWIMNQQVMWITEYITSY